ncbi:Acetoin dehydrogenase E2 subunit dihydrolipoyllysine-residue acetyltransferase, partial [Dysosmobacter welbionis]
TSAPSATGRQSRELQKGLACPKARPNRSRHRFAAPPSARRATAPERIQAPFSLDRARPVSLLARPIRGPAAPRTVGRGGAPKPTEWARKCPWGARERAQFSPYTETGLSGLCDDDMGVHPAGQALPGRGGPFTLRECLRILPPQRHGHAPGSAPPAGEFCAGNGVEPDARLLQGPVGDIVPGVHHHLAGADGQGIGAVAPLLPGGVDLAALAAGDQCHLIQLQVLLQDVLQPAVLLTDFHLPVFVQLHDEHRNLLEDVG